MQQRKIAIVGAGIAGATAARRLHDAGHAVTLFDKGRTIGGRMATRHARETEMSAALKFDHGAQYFTARSPSFVKAVQDWQSDGVVAPWGEPGWFVACPTMPMPVSALLGKIPVASNTRVTSLARDAAGWRLAIDHENVRCADAWDAVLLTCPAPQTAALLATAGLAWPQVDNTRYAPCWTLMLAHSGPPLFDATHRRSTDADAALAWIARDATKPGRADAVETVVAQASPAWSRAHLEAEAPAVQLVLLATIARMFPRLPTDAIHYARAHRWRYALVEQAAGTPCLWSPHDRIGAGGDWCIGGRVEAAYLSGEALAARVIEEFI